MLAEGVSPEQLAAVAVQEDVDLVAVTDADLGAAVVGYARRPRGRVLGHAG